MHSPQGRPQPPEPPANVLLVDDRPANLLVLEAVLGELGQNLVRATSGEEALARLLADDFAVVLLDVNMPGLGGLETARLIRSRERSRHTPVIFLTAHDGDEFPVAQAYRLGAVDYLVKPLVPEVLRAKVAVFVELAAERARARREGEQFRLLVQGAAGHAIFLLDAGGRVATWNAGARRIKGYAADEAVGLHLSAFYPPEVDARARADEALATAAREGRSEEEGWRVRKDGSQFWAEAALTALRDGRGTLLGFAKVTRDLTARREAEEQARELAAERAARAQAEAAARGKDEFLAMLAHELRNPLAPMLTTLEALGRAGDDPAVREESVGRLGRQARHLSRMVDDLLEASRLAHGRVSLRPERLDLGRLARTACEDRRALLEAAGLELAVEAPQTPVWVRGDPTRLDQILSNLLDNAAKFCGGRDQPGHVTVRVEAHADRKQATVAVCDDCAGIEPELLPRLFRPFEQADRSLDRGKGGLGLGLAVVRRLAELHGGTAEAASPGPDKGSTFTVRLPLEGEPEALASLPRAPTPVGGRHRVLVVEDSRDAADSLCLLLGLLGHEVRAAYDGPEGVRLAAEWLPDIVVSDVGLPGFDGYEVARRVRRLPGMGRAVLVALTGYGSDEDRRRGREAGFDHHLTKPAEPSDLQRVLAARTA